MSEGSTKSGTDFGRANQAASLIKKILEPSTKQYLDNKFFVRLRSLIVKIINMAPAELQGNAQITDGDLCHLRIDFNPEKDLRNLINFRPDVQINKAENLTIRIREMVPIKSFKYSVKATSVVISFVCGIIHFDLGKGGYTSTKELEIPLTNDLFTRKKITFPPQSAETSVVCVAMCIYHKANGSIITGNRWKAGAITNTWHIVDGEIKRFVYTKPFKKDIPDTKNTEGSVEWEEG